MSYSESLLDVFPCNIIGNHIIVKSNNKTILQLNLKQRIFVRVPILCPAVCPGQIESNQLIQQELSGYIDLKYVDDAVRNREKENISIYLCLDKKVPSVDITLPRISASSLFILIKSNEIKHLNFLFSEEIESLPAIYVESKDFVRLCFKRLQKNAYCALRRSVSEGTQMLCVSPLASGTIRIPSITGKILGIYSLNNLSIDNLNTEYKDSEISFAFKYVENVTISANSNEFFFETLPKRIVYIRNSESRFVIRSKCSFESGEHTWNNITHIVVYPSELSLYSMKNYKYISKKIKDDLIKNAECEDNEFPRREDF